MSRMRDKWKSSIKISPMRRVSLWKDSLWMRIFIYLGILFCIMNVISLIDIYMAEKKFLPAHVFIVLLEEFMKWAALMPLIVFLVKNFSVFEKRWLISIVVHFTAALIITGFLNLSYHFLHDDYLWAEGFANLFGRIKFEMVFSFVTGSHVIMYLIIVFVISTVNYLQKEDEKTRETMQLQVQLAQAQLDTLKTQLNPQFLFSALDDVSNLMASDINAARKMIARFSEFLRVLLDLENVTLVPLSEEVRTFELYLEIEKIRHKNLAVNLNVEDNTFTALVPHLIFQKFAETFINHGATQHHDIGKIEIFARKINNLLNIKLKINTIAPDNKSIESNATEINTTEIEKVLNALYGEQYKMIIENSRVIDKTVILEVPFQEN